MQIRRITASERTKRVAAYCRVSTDRFSQQESFETQVAYYSGLIAAHDGWESAGIFADEGTSGTSAKHRVQFRRMMEQAENGAIDLILVKSVSRFARNSIDCERYVRELKCKNVEVLFEREGISSFDANAEFLFSLSAIVAQEESLSLAKNIRWRIERDFARGTHFMGSNEVLGYDVADRVLVPNQERWIVRKIFEDYLAGMSFVEIAADLNAAGARRLRSKRGFEHRGISYILQNPIYVGDLQLQKQAPVDTLTKRPQRNVEYTTYYVRDDHEGIIERAIWEAAQERLQRERHLRAAGLLTVNCRPHALHGFLFCGRCGAALTRRTCTSSRGEHYKTWICVGRHKGKRGNGCKNASVREEKLLWEIWNKLEFISRRERAADRKDESEEILREMRAPSVPEDSDLAAIVSKRLCQARVQRILVTDGKIDVVLAANAEEGKGASG